MLAWITCPWDHGLMRHEPFLIYVTVSLAWDVVSDMTISLRPGCFKLPPVCQSLEETAEMWALTEQAHDGI